MTAKRVYSDKEISSVFKRASELQRTAGSDTSGLSLEDLEQIAAEVGIDPNFVKTAALELEGEQPWDGFQILGAPTSVDVERILDGEMTEAKWDEVVGEFRRVFGAHGVVGQVGHTRDWAQSDGDNELRHVTVSQVGTQTRVRVLSRMWVWATSLHVPLMSVAIAPISMVYSMAELGPYVETGIALSIVGAFHGIARLIYGSVVRKEDRKVRRLLSDLDEIVTRTDVALPGQSPLKDASEANRVDDSTERARLARLQQRERERKQRREEREK